MTGRSTTFDNYSSRATAFPLLCFRVDLSFPAIIGPPKDNGIYARSDLVTGPQGHHKPLTSWDQEFESAPLRQRVLISSNARPNHQKARASGLFCIHVVAEKITFRQVTRDSRPKSLLANLARPFGLATEEEWGRTRSARVPWWRLTNIFRPHVPARSKGAEARSVR